MKACTSCGRMTSHYAEFKCPNCSKTVIVRCSSCRETENKYACSSCKFVGP